MRGLVLAASLLLVGCASSANTPLAVVPKPATPESSPKLAGMQYLYGSAEADAISRQAWTALVNFVEQRLKRRDANSVVLAEDAHLSTPKFEPCSNKPKAAVFDVDETVLLNLGFEYDDLTGASGREFGPRWDEWERTGFDAVAPTPGAREALKKIRALGVTVIFNTNRKSAVGTLRALDTAGVGPAAHLETLFVQGDDNTGELKDARRWRISDKYCVIALGGDQLGDFSDLFNDPASPAQRRDRAGFGVDSLWGQGWFLFPNPVYGQALKGAPDDIFLPDKRWHPKESK